MQKSYLEDSTRKLIQHWQCLRPNHVRLFIFSPQFEPFTDINTAAVAASRTESSLAPLRAIQHRDSLGQTIGMRCLDCLRNRTYRLISLFVAEPDRSNPTRSRWERPLDTIRSFEAAIDGNYSRKSMVRSGEEATSRVLRMFNC